LHVLIQAFHGLEEVVIPVATVLVMMMLLLALSVMQLSVSNQGFTSENQIQHPDDQSDM
jgi:hypothetical protein